MGVWRRACSSHGEPERNPWVSESLGSHGETHEVERKLLKPEMEGVAELIFIHLTIAPVGLLFPPLPFNAVTFSKTLYITSLCLLPRVMCLSSVLPRYHQRVWPHDVISISPSTYFPLDQELLVRKKCSSFISLMTIPSTMSSTQAEIRIL